MGSPVICKDKVEIAIGLVPCVGEAQIGAVPEQRINVSIVSIVVDLARLMRGVEDQRLVGMQITPSRWTVLGLGVLPA